MTRRPRAERLALEAARGVALDHGLDCGDAVVLAAHTNVLVHLRPAPVVARVMTGTALLHGDVEEWLTRELAVGRFLGDRALAVRPTDRLPSRPYLRDGLWLTLWRFVEHETVAGLPGPGPVLGAELRRLHDALGEYRGELAPLREVRDWLGGLIDRIGAPALRAELDVLAPAVFEAAGQPIHGDASVSNLLRTGGRLLWNDLEDVCTGPVEWDLAGIVASVRARGANAEYVRGLVDAYGGASLDELDEFLAAHDLYAAVWQRWRERS